MRLKSTFAVALAVGFVLATWSWTRSESGPARPEATTTRSSLSLTIDAPPEERETLLRHPVTYAMAALRDTLPSYCPFGATASGGGYYLVHVNSPDSVRSQHTRLDQAIISAAEAETENPADSVWVSHDFELRIECEVPDADSVTVDPPGAEMSPGESLDLAALVWLGGEVVACGGVGCARFDGAEQVGFRQAMWLRERLGAGTSMSVGGP